MTRSFHTALVHLRLDVVGGLETARAILANLSELGEISAISSVYKRFLTAESVDLSAHLEFVIRFETEMSVEQTLQTLLSLCTSDSESQNRNGYAELALLTFDSVIQMSPNLTLPYPSLHQDPLIIRCAAEAWGQYEHPVYLKNLSDISRNAAPVRLVEFYMQGKSLVDF